MKKTLVLLLAIGLVTLAATSKITTNTALAHNSTSIVDENYKACIDACNATIASCTSCEKMCSKMDATKMATGIQLCKESIAICNATIQLMKLNSASVKDVAKECAVICEKCATECEKHDMAECIKCAADCRNTAKLCRAL